MQITEEWLESIKDEQGLTLGQQKLLDIWAKRQHFVGYDMLPDQVAHVIATCKGYRGMSQRLKDFLYVSG
jgi:hypothetical protein